MFRRVFARRPPLRHDAAGKRGANRDASSAADAFPNALADTNPHTDRRDRVR